MNRSRCSVARAGEMADPPDNPEYIKVRDDDEEVEGYLGRWRDGQWLYVSVDSATAYFKDE